MPDKQEPKKKRGGTKKVVKHKPLRPRTEPFDPPVDIMQRVELLLEGKDHRIAVIKSIIINLTIASEEDGIERIGDIVPRLTTDKGMNGSLTESKWMACQRTIASALRVQGMTWEHAAYVCGYHSGESAHRAVRSWQKKFATEIAEELVRQDAQRIDKLLAVHMPSAEEGSIKASEMVLKLLERRARMSGYDAPSKKAIEMTASIMSSNPADLSDKELMAIIKQDEAGGDDDAD